MRRIAALALASLSLALFATPRPETIAQAEPQEPVFPGSLKVKTQQMETAVTMEWLSWSHFRFTSVDGRVILTNPFVSNPDSPIKVEDITKADLILVPDGHGDEVGQTVDIAKRTGARVLAAGGVAR